MNSPMTDAKKISFNNLYFNRFLAIRYSTAFFLFLNLYWTIFLLGSLSVTAIFPFILFIMGGFTAFEQIKLYRNHSNRLPYANLFYRALLIIHIISMVAIYTPLYHVFFPFLKHSQDALYMLTVLCVTNLLIVLLILKKLNKIQRNEDKHYQRIRAYEEIIN